MRIGIVCPYDLASLGGVQQLTVELAERLRHLGHESILVGAGKYAHLRPGGDDGSVRVGRPFRVRGNESVVPLTLSPGSWKRVRNSLASVDVVHVHEPLIPLVSWVALGIHKPMVATFHADPPKWVRAAYPYLPLVRRRFEKCVLTAVSETASEAIPGAWGPVSIVPNAVSTADYQLPVGRVERRVTFLGRDEPRKGLDVLLGAWPSIRASVPEAELRVMGASREPGPEGVTYMGRVTSGEKQRVLSSSLIHVAPNTGGESFGMSLVEAMASGCAVVCSDLPAFKQVVGSSAITFPRGDEVSLAVEVTRLLRDPESAKALGERARQSARRFDWSEVTVLYVEAYARALGKR